MDVDERTSRLLVWFDIHDWPAGVQTVRPDMRKVQRSYSVHEHHWFRFQLNGNWFWFQNRYEQPMWYPEEVGKVLLNVYVKIGQIYYGYLPSVPLEKGRRTGKPRTPHNSTLCQACKDGVCVYRKWQLAAAAVSSAAATSATSAQPKPKRQVKKSSARSGSIKIDASLPKTTNELTGHQSKDDTIEEEVKRALPTKGLQPQLSDVKDVKTETEDKDACSSDNVSDSLSSGTASSESGFDEPCEIESTGSARTISDSECLDQSKESDNESIEVHINIEPIVIKCTATICKSDDEIEKEFEWSFWLVCLNCFILSFFLIILHSQSKPLPKIKWNDGITFVNVS